MVWERKVRSRKRYEVRLIIRSPGLAYALNDFLEVLSHLQREYEETRTTKTKKSKNIWMVTNKSCKSQMSQYGLLMVHVVSCTYESSQKIIIKAFGLVTPTYLKHFFAEQSDRIHVFPMNSG